MKTILWTRVFILGSLFAAGTLEGQSTPGELKVPYPSSSLEVVDMHLHTGSYDTMGPLGKKFLLSTLPSFIPDFLKSFSLQTIGSWMLDPYGPLIGIQSECTKAKIKYCGLFAVYAPETWGITPNKTIEKYLQDKRNRANGGKTEFFGFASVNVSQWDSQSTQSLAELETSLQNPKIKGIKLAFIHNNIPLHEEKYNPIYELAQRYQKPVYHHLGSSPLRKLSDFATTEEQKAYLSSYDPKGLELSISKFSEVTFILGHMGFDFNKEGFDFSEEIYRLAAKYPNVVLEVSAFGRQAYDPEGLFMDGVFYHVKEAGLIPRTIYGSDGPGNPGGIKSYLDGVLKSLERVGYTPSEAESILSQNSKKLLSL